MSGAFQCEGFFVGYAVEIGQAHPTKDVEQEQGHVDANHFA